MILIIFVAVAVLGASARPQTFIQRDPQSDSAIIQSHRLGGNFAYSATEGHAYKVQTPVYAQRTVPVGVAYTQGAPIVKKTTHIAHTPVTYSVGTQFVAPQQAPVVTQYAVGGVPAQYAVGGVPTQYTVGGVPTQYTVGGVPTYYSAGVPTQYTVGGVPTTYNALPYSPLVGPVVVQGAAPVVQED